MVVNFFCRTFAALMVIYHINGCTKMVYTKTFLMISWAIHGNSCLYETCNYHQLNVFSYFIMCADYE